MLCCRPSFSENSNTARILNCSGKKLLAEKVFKINIFQTLRHSSFTKVMHELLSDSIGFFWYSIVLEKIVFNNISEGGGGGVLENSVGLTLSVKFLNSDLLLSNLSQNDFL